MQKRCRSRKFYSIIVLLSMSLMLSGCLLSMEPEDSTTQLEGTPPFGTYQIGVTPYASEIQDSEFYFYGWRGGEWIDKTTTTEAIITVDLDYLYNTYTSDIRHSLLGDYGGTLLIEHRLKLTNGKELSHTWCFFYPAF